MLTCFHKQHSSTLRCVNHTRPTVINQFDKGGFEREKCFERGDYVDVALSFQSPPLQVDLVHVFIK